MNNRRVALFSLIFIWSLVVEKYNNGLEEKNHERREGWSWLVDGGWMGEGG